MNTEAQAIESARQQYRIAFRKMACGGKWNIYATRSGVSLDLDGCQFGEILVRDVQAMAEQTMVNALSAALRRGTPHIWTVQD